MPTLKNEFTGFVLAGGKSSRMGRDKFALEIEGETFLQRAVRTLSKSCQTVKIVLNEAQDIETDVEIIRDIYPNRGALGGIHSALRNCETKFAVILAVDLPLVTTQAVEILMKFVKTSQNQRAVVPLQNDLRFQPLCAVYRCKECLPLLEKLVNQNKTASVRDFLDLISPQFVPAKELSSDENLLFNVNFPEDFRTLF